MTRTRREDWIAAGLGLLRDEGERALTIDRVATQFGRTKGAFYHHFEDVDAFHQGLLEGWREQLTQALIEHTEAEADPTKRRARLAELAYRIDVRLELAIRAWGLRDARALAAISAVDERRIDFLEALWVATNGRAGARLLARLEYAAFLGIQQLNRDLSSRSARDLELGLERALQVLARRLRNDM